MWNRSETAGVWQVKREQGQVVQVERVRAHRLDELERKRALAAQREDQALEAPAVVSFKVYLICALIKMIC